jgi:hypothetical protein
MSEEIVRAQAATPATRLQGAENKKLGDVVDTTAVPEQEQRCKTCGYPLPKTDDGSLTKLWNWIWGGLTKSSSLRRLADSIPVLQAEITALIPYDQTQSPKPAPPLPAWYSQSLQLLEQAHKACTAKNVDLGWRCFNAAERFCLVGLTPARLRARAESLLLEVKDKNKGISDWRRESVVKLIGNSEGRLTVPPDLNNVVEAFRIVHEHFSNNYLKMGILRRRLNLLIWLCLLVLVAWFVFPPRYPSPEISLAKGQVAGTNAVMLTLSNSPSAAKGTNAGEIGAGTNLTGLLVVTSPPAVTIRSNLASLIPQFANLETSVTNQIVSEAASDADSGSARTRRERWLTIVLMGLLGATISGFTATLTSGSKQSVPDQLSASTMMLARFFVAAVSALAITILAGSTFLNLGPLTQERFWTLALISGFSDRLLLRAIGNVAQ